MTAFEVLPGLPPYGELPKLISNSRSPAYREGVVVQFLAGTPEEWVGNFQRGIGSFNFVAMHPNGREVVVIAGGECYLIDPATQKFTSGVGDYIEACFPIPESGALLLSSGLSFSRLGPSGFEWSTCRLAWDGFQKIRVTSTQATGEALHFDGSWHSFRVDLANGKAEGGAYDGPVP